MGWDKIESKRAAELQKYVRVGLRAAAGKFRLHIYIGRDIYQKLGWNVGCQCNIYNGTGKDEGWLRLTLAKPGEYTLRFTNRTVKTGSMWINIQKTPLGFSERRIEAMKVKHIIEPGGSLDISLPAIFWRKYDKKFPDEQRGRPLAHAARSPAEGALRHNGAQVTPE